MPCIFSLIRSLSFSLSFTLLYFFITRSRSSDQTVRVLFRQRFFFSFLSISLLWCKYDGAKCRWIIEEGIKWLLHESQSAETIVGYFWVTKWRWAQRIMLVNAIKLNFVVDMKDGLLPLGAQCSSSYIYNILRLCCSVQCHLVDHSQRMSTPPSLVNFPGIQNGKDFMNTLEDTVSSLQEVKY